MALLTSLQLITTSRQRAVAERLWPLYMHDLSEFWGDMPDSNGLYRTRLTKYFEDPDRCGYLIYSGRAPGGFALIRGLNGESRVMGDFFVVRAARRQHVGHEAAAQVIGLHPGKWAIPFQEGNPGAARFWRHLGAEMASNGCEEEQRSVPGKPQEPPDIWLRFSTTA